jgi:hypothetical protein
MSPPRGIHMAPLLSTLTHVSVRTLRLTFYLFSEILSMFLHVTVDRILGDVFVDIKSVILDIFPRLLEHQKKHGFLIVLGNG